MTHRDFLCLMIGILIGVTPGMIGEVRGIIRNTRWLGQERRKAERRKEDK